MRTNIDIDDDLMKAAMEATGKKTKKEVVEDIKDRCRQAGAKAFFIVYKS